MTTIVSKPRSLISSPLLIPFTSTSNLSTNTTNHNANTKPKTSTKTKRAKTMANLINSRPWSTNLETHLSSLSPSSLSKTTVLQSLRLIQNPSKALQFFNWVQTQGFSHTDQSCFLLLEILGRARNLNSARNFVLSIEKRTNGEVKLEDKYFNSLIRSYSNAGLFSEAIKVFSTMKEMGVSPSVISFNSLLLVLLRRGRTNMAKEVFDEMLNTYGVTPDIFTFNILIRGFCKNSMVEEGFRFFSKMGKFKCDPDVITYNTLVDGLCRAGKVEIACNLVKGMVNKGKGLSPNTVTYTTLIKGYCMKQEIDEALVVLDEMIERGLKPCDITYNTLIKGLCEAKKVDKIKEILEGVVGNGVFVPDTCTYNTLIDAHCDQGNLDGALKMFERMTELGVEPDSATYSILIRKLCQKEDFEKAEQLFDDMLEKEILLNDKGCVPLAAAYNPVFEYLCSSGKTYKAERVFRQLMRRGKQDPPSYRTLIMGHCREGTFEAGYKLLVLMLRRDFEPDVDMYESLIDGLAEQGKPLLALKTLESMIKSSYLPNASTFHRLLGELLKEGLAQVSANLIAVMLERKIRQNVNLSTNTVKSLFASGMQDRAFHVVNSLYHHGYIIHMEELIEFLCKSKKLHEAHKLLLFSLEKHQNVVIDKCDMVIRHLCKKKKLSEAFGLYYCLVEKGYHHQLRCLEDLRIALEDNGRVEEANFVSKRMLNPS